MTKPLVFRTAWRLCLLTLAMVSTGDFLAYAADVDAVPSLLPDSDLETDKNADAWPDGWPRVEGVSWENENGNHFLRLQQRQPGTMLSLYQPVAVPTDSKDLTLHFRVRYSGVKSGREAWNDARFIFHFKDADRKELNPGPEPISFRGDSAGWLDQTVHFKVPDGAALLEVMPALFEAESGALDIDDLRLVVGDEQPALQPAAVEVLDTKPYTPPAKLHVNGNQILTSDGKSVWLQGVNVPSLDWMPEGDHILQSVKVAVEDWKASVIRLPVNDDYWFGRGPRQDDGGKAYRALVENAIRIAARNGAYVVLDLHKYRAPRPQELEFWRQAAALYKDNPAVLFDVMNEPHDISWKIWRDGGTVEEKPAQGGTPAVTYESPGMQNMVNAIRASGARNIIIAGGLDWSYDLSGVLQGYELADKDGDGIVYSTHIYSWKKDWQNKVLAIAQKHPVLVGEVGCDVRRLPSVPDEQQEDPYTWMPDILGFIQQHKLHWTAWSFHTDATPRLLADWQYTPTPFFGAWVRGALLGARFQMTHMR